MTENGGPSKPLLVIGALIIVAVMTLIMVSGDNSTFTIADGHRSLERAQGTLDGLPFVAQPVGLDDIATTPAGCLNRATAEFVAGGQPCRFELEPGPDRLTIGLGSSPCVISVTGQPDVFDQRLDNQDGDREGQVRVALDGKGAKVEISSDPISSVVCRATLLGVSTGDG